MADREVLTVRQAEDDKLRKHCDSRFDSMMAGRGENDSEWYEIAGLCLPSRSKQLVENYKGGSKGGDGRQRNAAARSRRYNDGAIRSFEVCANGMLSGLSSRSRPWLMPTLTLADEDLSSYYPVSVWLDQVQRTVLSAFAISNFYEAALLIYLEMAAFGTGAVFSEADPETISVHHALTAGEYGIATGANQRPNALCRAYSLTTHQMVEKFVADRFDSKTLNWDRVTREVKEAWDRGNYQSTFTVRQLVEQNPAYVPGKIGRIGMRWRSIKWQPPQNDKKKFLCIEGHHDQPFMAPRWQTLNGEIWGTGRGAMALGSMRGLQLAEKRSGEAEDMAVKPPTWGPPSLDRVSMVPGAHTTVAAVDMQAGIQPIYEIPYQVMERLDAKVERVQRSIDAITYADLFMAITNMDGVQPRNVEELVRRHEEQLTQLGPVTDRANVEFLQVAFDRMFGILARGGLLPEAPPEIEGQEVQVDFTSVLAQAQKLLGISQTERAVSFVGNLGGVLPEALDNLDPDAIVADYWDRSGAPSTGLRDPKVRDQIRRDRAQQQQAERIAAMAPAAQKGADAARLLSEADTGDGGSLLERILP